MAIGLSAAPSGSAADWSTQKCSMPCSESRCSRPGAYAHSGSQNPRGAPKRRRCERRPASSWSIRPSRVATSGRTAWVAADGTSSTRPDAPASAKSSRARRRDRFEAGERPSVAIRLGLARGAQVGLHVGRIEVGRADAVLAGELEQPIRDARRLELVGEHRRHGQGQVPGPLEHRQVGADHRVEEPLLAERVGPEPLDVGHVGVQDDRDVADAIGVRRRVRVGHRRQTATKSSAAVRSASSSLRSRKSPAPIAGVNHP